MNLACKAAAGWRYFQYTNTPRKETAMNTALTTLTIVHVLISLAGLGSGFVVLWGLVTRRRLDSWTAVFLGTTIATSVTGFLFPADRVTPGHVLGVLSLIA